jgi:hypothetical protein
MDWNAGIWLEHVSARRDLSYSPNAIFTAYVLCHFLFPPFSSCLFVTTGYHYCMGKIQLGDDRVPIFNLSK